MAVLAVLVTPLGEVSPARAGGAAGPKKIEIRGAQPSLAELVCTPDDDTPGETFESLPEMLESLVDDGTVTVTCLFGSTWIGDWTGKTTGRWIITIDSTGDVSGPYKETFRGVYGPTGEPGTFTILGNVFTSSDAAGGTEATFACDEPPVPELEEEGCTGVFAGSTGEAHWVIALACGCGGYHGEWRPGS